MSDPTCAKRLRAEASAACAKLDEAAKQLALWAEIQEAETRPLLTATEIKTWALALAHQSGRLDMAISMAHTRRKR